MLFAAVIGSVKIELLIGGNADNACVLIDGKEPFIISSVIE